MHLPAAFVHPLSALPLTPLAAFSVPSVCSQGRVEELEMVAQEMALVALPPDALGPRGTRRIPDEEYSVSRKPITDCILQSLMR